ncbi:MAG TPA: biotin/lipoyl-binding protein [Kofleriaceae bacterium]|nr:biotin/lipoyl-binding protein [Kofleriaceae bacterium]
MPLLLLAAACGTHETTPDELDPTEAEYPAERAQAPAPIELVAVVSSHQAKVISADFEGRVEKLFVHNGERVKAGDVVAQLDATDLQSKLAEAQAQKASAEGEASRAYILASAARRAAHNEERLVRFGASAPEALNKANSDAAAAAAEGAAAAGKIKEASANIDELQKLIAAAAVKAPIDGQVSMVKAKEGEVAHKGTPIARVFDPHDLVIKFAVPREVLPLVKLGENVDVQIGKRVLVAKVRASLSEYDPTVGFTPFEAEIDLAKIPAEIQVGDAGHVHIKGAVL